MDFNTFWNWLSNGVKNVPTLGHLQNPNRTPEYISAVLEKDRVIITAGNGTVQSPITQKTCQKYINEYLEDINKPVEGNKRYVIALYLVASGKY